MKKRWLISIFAAGVFLDLVSKFLVKKYLAYGVPKLIFGNFLRFTYVENSGIIFGIGDQMGGGHPMWKSLILICFALLMVFLLIREFLRTKDTLTRVLYTFIFAGAFGNIFERIFGYLYYEGQWKLFYGSVVDFIDIGFGAHRWFFFNLADAYISVSVVLLVIRFWMLEKKR